MKDLVTIFKDITSQQWVSIITALVFLFAYYSNERRIEKLEQIIAKEQEASKKLFELYLECKNNAAYDKSKK